jgi:hypothetical protein
MNPQKRERRIGLISLLFLLLLWGKRSSSRYFDAQGFLQELRKTSSHYSFPFLN